MYAMHELSLKGLPNSSAITKITKSLVNNGAIAPMSNGRVGRRRPSRPENNVEQVNDSVDLNPKLSCWQRSQDINIHFASIENVLIQPMTASSKMAPLRIQRTKRLTFCATHGDRLISLRTRFYWTPNVPNLNPLDVLLCGFLKQRVYTHSPTTLD